VVNPADDLELEQQADYRVFTLAGDHCELGRQLALLEADQGPTSISPEEAAERRETAASILSDHDAPMCGHTDGMAPLWSVIADLANHRLAYTRGAPCRNEYQDMPWPGTVRDVPATTRE
jgi:hypothetical protein